MRVLLEERHGLAGTGVRPRTRRLIFRLKDQFDGIFAIANRETAGKALRMWKK